MAETTKLFKDVESRLPAEGADMVKVFFYYYTSLILFSKFKPLINLKLLLLKVKNLTGINLCLINNN